MLESIVDTGQRLDIYPGKKQEVTTLEPLSDFAYILALAQLFEYLLKNLDWRGVLETLALLLAVLCA